MGGGATRPVPEHGWRILVRSHGRRTAALSKPRVHSIRGAGARTVVRGSGAASVPDLTLKPQIKLAFLSGTPDLNRELIDRVRRLFPDLPLWVVSDFPPEDP